MPVLRKKHKENYTTCPNATIADERLSLSDLGLLVTMLSKPPEWSFSHKALQAELKLDKKGAIQKSVTNLQKAGYLKIVQERHNGRLGKATWYVSDTPCPNIRDTVLEGTPYPEIPDSGKSTSYKRKNIKKKETVPAVEGGAQLPEGIYYDPDSGEFRRKEIT